MAAPGANCQTRGYAREREGQADEDDWYEDAVPHLQIEVAVGPQIAPKEKAPHDPQEDAEPVGDPQAGEVVLEVLRAELGLGAGSLKRHVIGRPSSLAGWTSG